MVYSYAAGNCLKGQDAVSLLAKSPIRAKADRVPFMAASGID